MDEQTFRTVLREILRDELGVADAPLSDKYRGGELVLHPGRAGVQDKRVPIETFFHKIVMLRDRLRLLEQRINGSTKLADDEKLTLQQYVTACYGSLTTFNVLFRDEGDRFQGVSGDRD